MFGKHTRSMYTGLVKHLIRGSGCRPAYTPALHRFLHPTATFRTFSTSRITSRTRIIATPSFNQKLSSFTFSSSASRFISTNHKNENDPYHILGVNYNTTHEEIKKSYRQLFQRQLSALSNNEKMFKLQYAWDVLSNPPKALKFYNSSNKNPQAIHHVSHPRPSNIDSNSWVSDAPNILTDFQKWKMNGTIDYIKTHIGAEVAVVCIEDIDTHKYGSQIEKYAAFSDELMDLWGIGQKNINNGCLIILFRQGRRVEIRTGDSMRKTLPDRWLQKLQQEKMLPTFRRNEHGDGMLQAVMEICYKIGTDTSAQSREDFQRQILLEGYDSELEYERKKDEDKEKEKEKNNLKKSITSKKENTDTTKKLPDMTHTPRKRKRYRKPKHNGLFGGGTAAKMRLSQVWRKAIVNEKKKNQGHHNNGHHRRGNNKKNNNFDYEQWWNNNSNYIYMGSFGSLLGAYCYVKSRKKNQCDGCGNQMILDESFSKKDKLSKCEFMEDALGSIKCYPLICEECGEQRVRKEIKWMTGYSTCSKCKCASYYTKSRETTRSATYSSLGERKVEKECRHCGEHQTSYETIARLVRHTTSSGGSSGGGGFGGSSSGGGYSGGSSGGGGFGGGSSSGGGSGSSWLTADTCKDTNE